MAKIECPVARDLIQNAPNLLPLLLFPGWAEAVYSAQRHLMNEAKR